MKCRFCGLDKLNDKTIQEHYALKEAGKTPVCEKLDAVKAALGKLQIICTDCKIGKNIGVVLQARAGLLGLENEVCVLLEYGYRTSPRVNVDEVISLLGTILTNDSPGFREELKEAARRAQKGHGVQLGARSPKMVKEMLNPDFQDTYKRKFGEKALESLGDQVKALETEDAIKRKDGLGGDIVDYQKGKCIQIKAITSPSQDKFAARLREAAEQLKGDVAKEKREVPQAGMRRVADIRFFCEENPAFRWNESQFIQEIEQALKTGPKGKEPNLRAYVDIVRVTAAFGKRNFRITEKQVIVSLGFGKAIKLFGPTL